MVSVIVPVYNVKAYLLRCLTSLNNQTEKDIEIIIVNDGSTDGSDLMCLEFVKDKPKFRYISKENGGLMSAWMEGVKHANGNYIGFIDSDDYAEHDMFEKLYSKAKEYNADIVMCDRYNVYGEKINIDSCKCIKSGFYQNEQMDEIYENILPKFSGEHITNARWNKIFKTELFLSNTKYCEHRSRICEDRFITPSCMFGAKSFYYLNEPLYYYVNREGSNHSMPSPKLQDALELLYNIQYQMLNDYGLYDKYGVLLERANLNYLRLLLSRNFAGKGDKKMRKELAKRVLQSKEYNYCVKKHKKDLVDKAGLAVKLSFTVKSPSLFVFIFSMMGR